MIKSNKVLILTTSFLLLSIFTWLSFEEKKNQTPLTIRDLNQSLEYRLVGKKNKKLKVKKEEVAAKRGLMIEKSSIHIHKKSGQILSWLMNKDIVLEKRIARVSELGKDIKQIRPQLMKLIVSKNPYESVSRGPHSYNEHLFNQEAALRVHSMKILATQLKSKDEFIGSFLDIAENADNETIKTIAKEVLAYNQRGRSFFYDVPRGIRSLKAPQD